MLVALNSKLPAPLGTVYRRTTATPAAKQLHTGLTLPSHPVGFNKLHVDVMSLQLSQLSQKCFLNPKGV